jgi:hypothetical protein
LSCSVTTENLSHKAHTEKVKQRLTEHKEKRQIESKLAHTKPLGESDEDDDSAHAWVARSRILQEERVQAEKRVRIVYFHIILCLSEFNTVCFSDYCGNAFTYLYLLCVLVLLYLPQVKYPSSYHEIF